MDSVKSVPLRIHRKHRRGNFSLTKLPKGSLPKNPPAEADLPRLTNTLGQTPCGFSSHLYREGADDITPSSRARFRDGSYSTLLSGLSVSEFLHRWNRTSPTCCDASNLAWNYATYSGIIFSIIPYVASINAWNSNSMKAHMKSRTRPSPCHYKAHKYSTK